MSDTLSRLAARAVASPVCLRPRPRLRFADPAPATLDWAPPDEATQPAADGSLIDTAAPQAAAPSLRTGPSFDPDVPIERAEAAFSAPSRPDAERAQEASPTRGEADPATVSLEPPVPYRRSSERRPTQDPAGESAPATDPPTRIWASQGDPLARQSVPQATLPSPLSPNVAMTPIAQPLATPPPPPPMRGLDDRPGNPATAAPDRVPGRIPPAPVAPTGATAAPVIQRRAAPVALPQHAPEVPSPPQAAERSSRQFTMAPAATPSRSGDASPARDEKDGLQATPLARRAAGIEAPDPAGATHAAPQPTSRQPHSRSRPSAPTGSMPLEPRAAPAMPGAASAIAHPDTSSTATWPDASRTLDTPMSDVPRDTASALPVAPHATNPALMSQPAEHRAARPISALRAPTDATTPAAAARLSPTAPPEAAAIVQSASHPAQQRATSIGPTALAPPDRLAPPVPTSEKVHHGAASGLEPASIEASPHIARHSALASVDGAASPARVNRSGQTALARVSPAPPFTDRPRPAPAQPAMARPSSERQEAATRTQSPELRVDIGRIDIKLPPAAPARSRPSPPPVRAKPRGGPDK